VRTSHAYTDKGEAVQFLELSSGNDRIIFEMLSILIILNIKVNLTRSRARKRDVEVD